MVPFHSEIYILEKKSVGSHLNSFGSAIVEQKNLVQMQMLVAASERE